ncbi:uncharacterized protein LOC110729817 [Chenopodium quinoa]|uniref:uncharacterized protein LOC110729817 n=1 Tax=Chenopodium quinoa TaxID=63459 RepID=UPI000B787EC7|nr:uncharacterized protein LOC110729817 [Chenopodium quinoa]
MIPLDSQKCTVETYDCGVFCLYHCATYEGKAFKCKSLTQALERRRFRVEICASLVLRNLNLRRDDDFKSVKYFSENNEEIYVEVKLNEKIIMTNKMVMMVEQSKKAKKASRSKSKKRTSAKGKQGKKNYFLNSGR